MEGWEVSSIPFGAKGTRLQSIAPSAVVLGMEEWTWTPKPQSWSFQLRVHLNVAHLGVTRSCSSSQDPLLVSQGRSKETASRFEGALTGLCHYLFLPTEGTGADTMLQKQFVLWWKRAMRETGLRKNIEKLFRQRKQFQTGFSCREKSWLERSLCRVTVREIDTEQTQKKTSERFCWTKGRP